MATSRWQRIQEVFDLVVDLSPSERGAVLARECTDDSELRREVESLLEQAASDGAVIDRVLDAAANDAGAPLVADGEMIGPYRLQREIGAGGMGAVYLAERVDQEFEQRVAIKIVRAGALNTKIIERFRAERQILAQLDHPNIARLLDGGTTTSGIPYFVMEYVEGEPIDEYCDARRLSVRSRLVLFREVCAAVQSAHRRLVVHRDLKPSNILVTAEGVPKLLDFGIAKVMEPKTVGASAETVWTDRVMTPEYASPEQVRGEPVSTATDVYALGLLLYELLTGHRAHRLTSYQPSEVERVVCDAVPQRPSTAATREPLVEGAPPSEPTAVAIGRARGMAPNRLKKRLAGDLDNIVLMALRKEPERRYGSVAELSEDIRRHLEELPVVAHADSLGYRIGKFVRRHRAGVAAAGGVLLLVSSLVGFYTARVARARDQARIEAESASEVADFMVGLFRVSDPGESRGNSVTAREVLDAGIERIDQDLAGQPAVQARLKYVMGRVFNALGLYREAESLVDDAIELLRPAGPHDPDFLRSKHEQSMVYWYQGRFAEAETAAREAYEAARVVFGPDDAETFEFRNLLGLTVWRQGRFEEAEVIYREILAARRERGVQDAKLVASLNNLANVYQMTGQLEDAARFLGEAVEIGRETPGEDHPGTLDAMNNLAMTYDRLGRSDEARSLFERVIELRRRVLGEDHPRTLSVRNNLATLVWNTGDLETAEGLFRGLSADRLRLLGSQHPDTLYADRNLAQVLGGLGRLEEAERMHRKILQSRKEVLGPDHVDTVQSMQDLAGTLRATGRQVEAERTYRQALGVLAQLEDESRAYDEVTVCRDLASLLLQQARVDEAATLLQRAAEMLEGPLSQDQLLKGTTCEVHGRALEALGRHDEAEKYLVEAVESLRAFAENSEYRQAVTSLAAFYQRQGRSAEAAALGVDSL